MLTKNGIIVCSAYIYVKSLTVTLSGARPIRLSIIGTAEEKRYDVDNESKGG